MAGHGCSKNGAAPLAFCPAIHVFLLLIKTWMRDKRGHDEREMRIAFFH
jgi:hypothetical protein